MKAAIAAVLSISFLFLSSLTRSVQAAEPEENHFQTRFTSLHKSLLVPGWGQFTEKRYWEGIVFFTAEVFALYKFFSHNRKGNQYYDQYRAADNVEDAVTFRELTEKFDTQRNQYLLVAAGIWAVNLVDIYFIVKGKSKRKNALELRVESGAKNLAFTLRYRF